MWSWIKRTSIFVLCLALLGFAALARFALSPLELQSEPLDFSIKPGSSLRSATREIADAGVALNALQFNLLGRILGKAGRIKAGSYEISRGITPLALLDKLAAGEVTQTELAFIEGWTFRQMRAALDADPDVQHDSAALSDAEIMNEVGAPGRSPEGLFFPDTYLFGKGTSDLVILRRAYRAMQRELQTEWQRRAPDLPYRNAYDALIMASVVEKETGRAADRPLVAGVLVNRLRIGMMLQSDPSVIYGMGDKFHGNLSKKDLLRDNPHNTYTRSGLPPTPISMPGRAAIEAALNPAKTSDLYFVARGDGTSQFSRTLAEHERAVEKYQRRGKR